MRQDMNQETREKLEQALLKEFEDAKQALRQAEQNFDLAVGNDYVDVATYDLKIAQDRVANVLRKMKLLKLWGQQQQEQEEVLYA